MSFLFFAVVSLEAEQVIVSYWPSNEGSALNSLHSPPQDVGAADAAEGPVEDSGSKSNRELETTFKS